MTAQQRTDLLANAKVYTAHLRTPVSPQDPADWRILPAPLLSAHALRERGYGIGAKGGLTLVQVEFADGNVARGAARCSPRDNYCKATGRNIALGRALKVAADNA